MLVDTIEVNRLGVVECGRYLGRCVLFPISDEEVGRVFDLVILATPPVDLALIASVQKFLAHLLKESLTASVRLDVQV